VLYSLVALGFVLIFKASGVFNFAQGAMVLFAALTFVRLLDILKDSFAPITLSLIITIAMMVMLAMAIERLVLRPLVNQPGISLFMATLGIAYFLDGFGQTLWGSDIYTLDIGIPKGSIFILESVFDGGVLVAKEDLVATVIAGLLVVTLAIFFQKTRIGRALRAVADDHQAAQSIGIPLNYIWVIVWTVAGLVALVAGVIWGSKLGVQFSLSLIALKALPVLILGGFESVLGAVIGGLIIGAGEKLSEIYIGPYVGGGIEYWFAYMLALGFLMFRPQGLFGEVHIDRV
jgi:branched-chain amino acid transport system permease protein